MRSAASDRPAVSVTMDVCNGAPFLNEALESLAAQTFGDFEIVLCAHGTTEEAGELIRCWQARDDRLRVIPAERTSLSRAHNIAAKAARGTFLARLDADDIALPDRLGIQYRKLTENPQLALLGSAAEIMDKQGRKLCIVRNGTTDGEIRDQLRRSCPFVHSSVMMRADAFWQAGGYREGLNLSEDYDLYARILDFAEAANLPQPLLRYRIHTNSLTSQKPHRMAITNFCVRAATIARRECRPEPFINGIPSLRRARQIFGLSSGEAIHRIRSIGWQSRVSRQLLAFPTPLAVASKLRALALALGLRPAYSAIFQWSSRVAAARAAPARRRRRHRAAARG
jgi:glycosyltransferase involved in cell wall biosynthesis